MTTILKAILVLRLIASSASSASILVVSKEECETNYLSRIYSIPLDANELEYVTRATYTPVIEDFDDEKSKVAHLIHSEDISFAILSAYFCTAAGFDHIDACEIPTTIDALAKSSLLDNLQTLPPQRKEVLKATSDAIVSGLSAIDLNPVYVVPGGILTEELRAVVVKLVKEWRHFSPFKLESMIRNKELLPEWMADVVKSIESTRSAAFMRPVTPLDLNEQLKKFREGIFLYGIVPYVDNLETVYTFQKTSAAGAAAAPAAAASEVSEESPLSPSKTKRRKRKLLRAFPKCWRRGGRVICSWPRRFLQWLRRRGLLPNRRKRNSQGAAA